MPTTMSPQASAAIPVAIDDPRSSKRIAYTAMQAVAPVRAGSALDEASFVEVECHDISMTGLSFWSDVRPETPHLCARLSTESSVTFMLMEVRHVSARQRPQGSQFMVGCEFVSRIQVGAKLP